MGSSLANEIHLTYFRIDANSAVLCNYEVYGLLQDVKKQSSDKKKKSQLKNLATITYQVSCLVAGTFSSFK